MATDADRLARLRRDLTRPHRYSEEVEFLMGQLDAALAARQQAEQERDTAQQAVIRQRKLLDKETEARVAAEQQVTDLSLTIE